MPKRVVFGAKPEFDPIEDMRKVQVEPTTFNQIRWNNRLYSQFSGRLISVGLILILFVLFFPLQFLIGSTVLTCLIPLLFLLRRALEQKEIVDSPWSTVPEHNIMLEETDYGLRVKGTGGLRYLTAMSLSKPNVTLSGSLGALIRGMDMSVGFLLQVELTPVEVSTILGKDVLSEHIEWFLTQLSEGELLAYFSQRGGLWLARTIIIGHGAEINQTVEIQNSVRGALPSGKWKNLTLPQLVQCLKEFDFINKCEMFYSAGNELSEWLIQLASELAPEVGSNVPGEFLAPLRPQTPEVPLGTVFNSETLQIGPPVGLSSMDLKGGLLVCGGSQNTRLNILSIIVSQLLRQNKHVLALTTSTKLAALASLAPDGLVLELGQNFVVNPVDPEGIPIHEYVAGLMKALEVVAGTDLRGAVELELALSRVLSVSNSTLADVNLQELDMASDDVLGESFTDRIGYDQRNTHLGMNAIRTLHQGTGARAFYGSQSFPIEVLANQSLVVVLVRLGSLHLEKFALDLLSLKIAGLSANPDLVIVLDGAHNIETHQVLYRMRDGWAAELVRRLLSRGPLLISLEHPSALSPEVIGYFSSGIVSKLTNSVDIKVASDLLGFNVINVSLHSKARSSPRETSFLRTLPPEQVLLKPYNSDTCLPVQLMPSPSIEPLSLDETQSRLEKLESDASAEKPERSSLLTHISGRATKTAFAILRLLERYEPLTVGAIQRFLTADGTDIRETESVLNRLERASVILRGHETHGNVSYVNYRLTIKGMMLLKQVREEGGAP